jgi:protocadherin Fat 1/2/3
VGEKISSLFSLTLGILHTAMHLDRETKQEYLLTATATDGGGLSCETEVRVFLRDINDNPPEFTGNFRDTLTIQEDARVNTLLTRVTTVDRDTGWFEYLLNR